MACNRFAAKAVLFGCLITLTVEASDFSKCFNFVESIFMSSSQRTRKLEIDAMLLRYDPSVAMRIKNMRPDLLKKMKIGDITNYSPITLYRGLGVQPQDFEYLWMNMKTKLRSIHAIDKERIYVSPSLEHATEYALLNPMHHSLATIIEFEIPRNLLLSRLGKPVEQGSNDLRMSVRSSDMLDQRPFIKRIGVMDRKNKKLVWYNYDELFIDGAYILRPSK